MGFNSVMRYRALKVHKKSGRSAAIEARGGLIPFHSRRSTLAGVVRQLMPKQNAFVNKMAADENVPAKPTDVQKRKSKRELEGRGDNAANTEQSTHNQPRFSGDKLAQFRQLARGSG